MLQLPSPSVAPNHAAELAPFCAAVDTDRRWQTTRGCTDAVTPTLRQFCTEAHQLRVEQVAAAERERLQAQERTLRGQIETLRAGGASVSADPQVEALAALIGVSPGWLRAALGVMLAAVLELGAVVLVLLIAGPLLRAPAKSEPTRPAEPPKPEVMRLPPQVDRSFWQRQRNRRQGTIAGGGDEH